MRLIDAGNAESYLRDSGRLPDREGVSVQELAGGVSNVVLLVARRDRSPLFVLKQAREQLRVADPWYCSPTRIWREIAVLQACHRALASTGAPCQGTNDPEVLVPSVLFVDRDEYLFAMTAVGEHSVWKTQLLAGECSAVTASGCGRLLGTLHARTWGQPELAQELGDRAFFDALRIDPYYRHVARLHPDLAAPLTRIEQSLAEHPRCLVHGDFSPKNLLVQPGRLTLVDFEVGHYGDPAFDLGFFLSHLLLKAVRSPSHRPALLELVRTFWARYGAILQPVCGATEYESLQARAIDNLAGCLSARVDGKSRVDYLDPSQQALVRRFARDLLQDPPIRWSDVEKQFEATAPWLPATRQQHGSP